MSRRLLSSSSSPPTLEITPMGKLRSLTSISTVRSSSFPSRSCKRSFDLVVSCVSGTGGAAMSPAGSNKPGLGGGGGSSRSSSRSSPCCSAFCCTASRRCVFTMLIASSVKSRMMDSTSRPTYPTSVNLDASTLMKGAWASLASRLAISVFPTPVGPIMMMFFGITSSRRSGDSCWRRQRFRNAMATIRLASFWPITYRFSSSTIWRGVRLLTFNDGVSVSC